MLRMVEKGCLLRMVDGGNLGSDLSTDKEHSGWASLSWDICTSNRKNIRHVRAPVKIGGVILVTTRPSSKWQLSNTWIVNG